MPGRSPLDDALAVWHMNDTDSLKAHGAVQVGVALSGAERDASIARGGDGRVALFQGGYLGLISAAEALQPLQGQAMSFCIRLRDTSGRWDKPLFSCDDAGDPLNTILYGADGIAKARPAESGRAGDNPYYHLFAEEGGPRRLAGSSALLEYRWRTEPVAEVIEYCKRSNAADAILADAFNGVLTLDAPVAMLGPTVWHDVVFRFGGSHLELFVDGVLLDEQWGCGSLSGFSAPFLLGAGWSNGQLQSGFHGQVDHVALWDHALSDEEISQLGGGEKNFVRRRIEILGPEQVAPNYWRPRGHNTYAGDCMLLWDDERLHLFYLFDRRQHTSKWNLGAHQYAHMATTDLVHWQRHPLAVPLDQSWECAIGTGDFIFVDGLYTAFFTDCGGRCQFPDKPHQGSGIFRATSKDGIHYDKDYTPVAPTSATACADCSIFRDPATGHFHLLTQDRLDGGAEIIAHYVSSDLRTWSRRPRPFLEPGIFGPCPHLFFWNAWYYFAMANRTWKARSVEGPWEALWPEQLTQLSYPKTARFKGNRLLTAGWIGHGGWGGDLVFRELVQHQDGSLGTRFVPEMIPAGGPMLDLHPVALQGELDWDGGCLNIGSTQEKSAQEATATLAAIPDNLRLAMKVEPACAVWRIDLLDDDGGGISVKFDRRAKQVEIAGQLQTWGADTVQPLLRAVDCLDRQFALDLIVKDGLIDICVDQQHTILTRRAGPAGRQLRITVQRGSARFSDIAVRPLRED